MFYSLAQIRKQIDIFQMKTNYEDLKEYNYICIKYYCNQNIRISGTSSLGLKLEESECRSGYVESL